MMATTLARPYAPSYITHPLQLPGGGAEFLEFYVGSDSGARFVSSSYVRTWSRSGRLVGILSPTPPPTEAFSALSPSASYVVGEQLGALGTVAFVLYAPQEALFDDKERAQPSFLEEPGTAFLTLYAPDGPVEAELGFNLGAMQFRCNCRVQADVRAVHRWPESAPPQAPPPPPQGGTQGGGGN